MSADRPANTAARCDFHRAVWALLRQWRSALIILGATLLLGCKGGESIGAPETAPPEGARSLLGAGPFLVCVQVVDDSATEGDAIDSIRVALEEAVSEGRWPHGAPPEATVGCPLPPVALTMTDQPIDERRVCGRAISPFRVQVYVANVERFEERFSSESIRRAPHEYWTVSDTRLGTCFVQASEAWYLTPDELGDQSLLDQYVRGIFLLDEMR